MNEQPLDPGLRAVFALVPGVAPVAMVDRALAEASTIPQRRPRFPGLDPRAWPPRPRTVSDPAVRRSARLMFVTAVTLLLIAGVVAVGARLLETRPPRATIEIAGSLAFELLGPQALALPDGRILAYGQGTESIFDPATGESANVSLGPFVGPAALALPDGRVLLLGSVDRAPSSTRATVVGILDPATGAVTIVGELPVYTFDPGLAVLADGRLLVSGGLDPSAPVVGYFDMVWAFDPATGTATSLAPLRQPRMNHSMVVLDDGRVLIAGGAGPEAGASGGDVLEVETYDPETGESSVVGTINPGRGLAAGPAVRLGDGRVLVPGGFIPDPPCGASRNYRQATFIYDPIADELVPGPELPHAVGSAVALLDSRAVVFGNRSVMTGGCDSGTEPFLEPWLGVVDPTDGTVYESTDTRTGAGTLALELDSAYEIGVLLPDGRVALITGGPDDPIPNRVDILTIGD
jgi:hypothetical protein